MDPTNKITVAFINIRGQTGFNLAKQFQIEEFIRHNRIDILHLQESNIEENTFNDCKLITSSFNLIVNNSQNKYGTASWSKMNFKLKISLWIRRVESSFLKLEG